MRSKPGRLWLLAASLLGMAAEAASPLSSFRSLLPSDCCFAPSAKQQLTLAVRAWHAREYRLALCCAGEVIRASSPGHTGSAETAPWVVAAASLERLGESAKASSIYAAVDSALGAYQGARGWEYVGPFITGKSELDGDPLEDYGGFASLFASGNRTARFPSELANGGYVGWSTLETSPDGGVVVAPSSVDWNFLLQSLSMHEVLEHQGWAIASFFIARPAAYLLRGQGLHTLHVDHHTRLAADLYGTGHVAGLVRLEPGVHTISVHVRAKVQGSFRVALSLAPTDGPLVHPPAFTPDLLDGRLFSDLFSVPVFNTDAEQWVRVTKAAVVNKAAAAPITGVEVADPVTRGRVAPGQTTAVGLRLISSVKEQDHVQVLPVRECKERSVTVEVSVTFETEQGREVTRKVSVPLRCRLSSESFIFTFIDHDGTVSRAAAVAPPKSKAEEQLVPVLLSLHGTGIKPSDQADSYKVMPKKSKKYRFGVKGYWVLAPSRHGAHNWEHTGHRSALASLDALVLLTSAYRAKTDDDDDDERLLPAADGQRVLYAGHSMGGHGAWQLATHAPDRAIAVAAAAGWLTKEHYGDANALLKLDVSRSAVSPALRSILESTVAENDNELLASNLKGLRVLARTGDKDATVSPWFSRRYVRQLRAEGVNVTLSEVPRMEHWWWDTKEANDGGVTNDAEMRAFFASCLQQRSAVVPEHFTLALFNPATHEGRGGLRVMQQELPFDRSRVQVNATEPGVWTIRPDNVRRLRFRPLASWGAPPSVLKIGGGTFDTQGVVKADLCLDDHTRKWSLCPDLQHCHHLPPKSPASYGPAREVHNRPLWIVIGSVEDQAEAEELKQAAMYLANLHYVSTSAAVRVVRDADADVEDARKGGVNLVLLGPPWSHSLYRSLLLDETAACPNKPSKDIRPAGEGGKDALQVLPSLSFQQPDKDGRRSFQLGPVTYAEPDQGLLFLAPWRGNGEEDHRLLLGITGNSLAGLRHVMRLATPTIPPMTRAPFTNLIPDFVVVGKEVLNRGMGGILAAGFWGNDWEWMPEASYRERRSAG